jgi:hypothetical protein
MYLFDDVNIKRDFHRSLNAVIEDQTNGEAGVAHGFSIELHFGFNKYIPRGHIQLCYQDTDSIIAAFSNSNIDLCVPEDVRNTEEYKRDKVLFTLSLRGSPKP